MMSGSEYLYSILASLDQRNMTDRIKDMSTKTDIIEPVTTAVMGMRLELRNSLLKLKNEKSEEKFIKTMEEYYKRLRELYISYFKCIETMSTFEKFGDVRAFQFMQFYLRYAPLLVHTTQQYHIDKFNTFNFRIDAFKSGWMVIALLVDQPLHTMFEMSEITDTTTIVETDWDGTKPKTGLEILRRNGECSGVVYTLLYIEESTDEVKGKKKSKQKKTLHFYSVSLDGKEFRHYPLSVEV